MYGDPVPLDIVQGANQWFGFRLFRIPPHDEVVVVNGAPTLKSVPGTPVDLTGWTFRAAFAGGTAQGPNQMTIDNSLFTIRTDLPNRPGEQWVIMHLPNTKTRPVTQSGEYNVWAKDSNGHHIPIAHGPYEFNFTADI